ncbi:MAG: ABC transporter transmembrane domain-containing protein [Marinoscillum sp.]|uniref:ABC transporter ATP-binding protein n=1 Tax=Marinoscillum sp. TaxID=2024838 RepID=UPI0032FBD91F
MARRVDLPDEDKRKISRENFKKLLGIFRFMLPYKTFFIVGMLALFLSSSIVMIFPYITGKLVDTAVGEHNWLVNGIDQIALVMVAILLIQSTLSFTRVYMFAQVSENSMADIRKALFDKLLHIHLEFFDKRRVGELISRITNDVAFLKETFSTTLAEFFRQITIFIIGVGIIFWESAQLTLLMLSVFPVLIIVALIFGRFIRKLSTKTQDSLADANVIVEESLQAVNIVKSFTNENFENKRYSKNLIEVVRLALKTAVYRGVFFSFIIFGLFGAIVLVLWYGAGMVSDGSLSIGDLTSFIIYTMFIGASVGGLGEMYSQIQKAIGASERVLEILEEEQEGDEPNKNENIDQCQGDIEFKDVCFSYPTRKEIEVLKGINLKISNGSKIALVGHSGAGKSTIIQLLLRFYNPDSGTILLDGKDVTKLSLKNYRHHVGMVPQEVILFGGTIKENIAYGRPEADFEEIVEAARKANALQFIESFPDAFETRVGERGIKLSGGQRQRIAIARALLKDPKILVLDEATSSLDAESEMLVQEALDELMKNRTTIIIAHRLATIRKVDKIFVINDGKIEEEGLHDELAFKEEGIYSKLVKLQFDLSEN